MSANSESNLQPTGAVTNVGSGDDKCLTRLLLDTGGSSPPSGRTHTTDDAEYHPSDDQSGLAGSSEQWVSSVTSVAYTNVELGRARVIEKILDLNVDVLGRPMFQVPSSRNSAIAVLNDASASILKSMVNNKFVDFEWCKLCALATSKSTDKGLPVDQKKGYIQLKEVVKAPTETSSEQVVIGMLHQLACILGSRQLPDVYVDGGKKVTEQASHLCGRSTCFEPGHLTWESDVLNGLRKNCLAWVRSPSDPIGRVNACLHEPRCIRFIPGVDWDLFRANPSGFISEYHADPRR